MMAKEVPKGTSTTWPTVAVRADVVPANIYRICSHSTLVKLTMAARRLARGKSCERPPFWAQSHSDLVSRMNQRRCPYAGFYCGFIGLLFLNERPMLRRMTGPPFPDLG